MTTDFPKKGDNKKISLRNSSFPRFDYAYTLDIKENYPDVWELGGNIRGNEAFNLWGRARDGDESQEVLDWIKEREAWSARHYENFRPAGVMALAKWGTVGDIGESEMKQVLNAEKDKQERQQRRTGMSKLQKAIQAIKEILHSIDRTIKEVEIWDGSATNYASTDAYCRACLIDVNEVAGRDTKVQSHCFLPVREDGDPASTYVDRAVFAAAGGRGISRIQKPDDVSQDDWNTAVEGAAKNIISAYEQMDSVAPESVYLLAGMEQPEKRAISFPRIYDQVSEQLSNLWSETDGWFWLVDVFEDRGLMFAIVAREGKLYRHDIRVEGDEVVVSPESVRVQESYMPVGRSLPLQVFRQTDGRYRWLQVSCSAVMNRVGEIDSTLLFDSFAEYARDTKQYPILNYHHYSASDDPVIQLGQADYVARDGYTYITSGLFDDTPLGRAAAVGVRENPDYWGHSIEFAAYDSVTTPIAEGIDIPTHVRGINTEIALVPEHKAAALFTGNKIIRGGDLMNKDTKNDLIKLVGNELADEFEERVDGTNRSIKEQGLIARSAKKEAETGDEEAEAEDEQAEVEEEATEVGEEGSSPNDLDVTLDDSFIPDIVDALVHDGRLAEALRTVGTLLDTDQLDEIAGSMQALSRSIDEVSDRLSAVETAEQERTQALIDDAPMQTMGNRRALRLSYRPKAIRQRVPQTRPAVNDGADSASVAARTLDKLPKITR